MNSVTSPEDYIDVARACRVGKHAWCEIEVDEGDHVLRCPCQCHVGSHIRRRVFTGEDPNALYDVLKGFYERRVARLAQEAREQQS